MQAVKEASLPYAAELISCTELEYVVREHVCSLRACKLEIRSAVPWFISCPGPYSAYINRRASDLERCPHCPLQARHWHTDASCTLLLDTYLGTGPGAIFTPFSKTSRRVPRDPRSRTAQLLRHSLGPSSHGHLTMMDCAACSAHVRLALDSMKLTTMPPLRHSDV